MLKNSAVEIVVTNNTLKWYREKGYKIPTHIRQLWAIINGKRVKNGKMISVANGTKIVIKVQDLPPQSNKKIDLTCPRCKKDFRTTYGAYRKKKGNLCTDCVKRGIKGTGSHGYWTQKLITDNEHARCDISSEVDKRFLVLHHLDSVSMGGENTPSNYVILSANYHMAFHNWVGGTNIACTREQYAKFKEVERNDRYPG